MDYRILLKLFNPEEYNYKYKDITLIKKETKPMRYKVLNNALSGTKKDDILIPKDGNYFSVKYEYFFDKNLVENNPGFFEKIEFTEENINTLHNQIANLNNKFYAFGTSEGFIKEFKEFEKMVKDMGELL